MWLFWYITEDSPVLVLQLGFVHDATEMKCKAEIFSHNSSGERTQIFLSCDITVALYNPPNGQSAPLSNLMGGF